MTETAAIDTWLYTTLSGDATLKALVGTRVYDGLAPQGATLPYVVFQMQAAGPDLIYVGGIRLLANVLYAVRGVAQGNGFGSVESIAERIDQLLDGVRATNVGGVVLSCHRERPLKLPPEVDEGVAYYHLGGVYRIRARA